VIKSITPIITNSKINSKCFSFTIYIYYSSYISFVKKLIDWNKVAYYRDKTIIDIAEKQKGLVEKAKKKLEKKAKKKLEKK